VKLVTNLGETFGILCK